LLVFLTHLYHDTQSRKCKVWRILRLTEDLLDFQGDCSVELDIMYGNRKLRTAVVWTVLFGNLTISFSLLFMYEVKWGTECCSGLVRWSRMSHLPWLWGFV